VQDAQDIGTKQSATHDEADDGQGQGYQGRSRRGLEGGEAELRAQASRPRRGGSQARVNPWSDGDRGSHPG
jgi:hypothetical protein